MFSPNHFKPAKMKSTADILNHLQKPLPKSERREFLRQYILSNSDADASKSMMEVSAKWTEIVQKKELELITKNETVRLTSIMLKSKLDSGYRSNIEELREVLDQAVEMYTTEEAPEKCTKLLQRAIDIYGELGIKSLCDNIDKSISLKHEIKDQQIRAELTLELTGEILQELISADSNDTKSSACLN